MVGGGGVLQGVQRGKSLLAARAVGQSLGVTESRLAREAEAVVAVAVGQTVGLEVLPLGVVFSV